MFLHKEVLHTENFAQGNLYTDGCTQKNTFTQRGFYAEKLARTEILTHRSFETKEPSRREALELRPPPPSRWGSCALRRSHAHLQHKQMCVCVCK